MSHYLIPVSDKTVCEFMNDERRHLIVKANQNYKKGDRVKAKSVSGYWLELLVRTVTTEHVENGFVLVTCTWLGGGNEQALSMVS
ncbi:hypothetical protein [Vibrio sp. ER1A]|uniref:hypothetical protein n=1 Tax=Vibrio sp. ER1A TaxID=1517681 RepID=UPI0004DD8220|nr:hypothetical protein [Vibrio sp. ER1A]KFA98758.1 hypothetical protein HW45_06950 [Vibrio sp. ER1A]